MTNKINIIVLAYNPENKNNSESINMYINTHLNNILSSQRKDNNITVEKPGRSTLSVLRQQIMVLSCDTLRTQH